MQPRRFKIDQKATITKKITLADVRLFANASGDQNPLHLNLDFCKKTIFGKPIAPGALIGGLIAAVLSSKLPGSAYACSKQQLNFIRPAFVGERITTEVRILWQSKNLKKVRLAVACKNSKNKRIVNGVFSGYWVMEEE